MLQGWVYVMVNASMRNMVKVGRTTREPRLRVAELSSPTGIPLPFVLEFRQIYADCARAEREIHEALDRRGLRVRANREFFHGPARNIIRIITAHAGQEPPPGNEAVLPGEAFVRRLAERERLQEGARLGDHFCYAKIAALHADEGDTQACLRTWDLFFAAHVAACGHRRRAQDASPDETGIWTDPRMTAACRSYIACCLVLGRDPGYRSLLLPGAAGMMDQQMADLERSRGKDVAPRIALAMRWIYENLDPDEAGDGGPPGTDAASDGRPQQSHTQAA